MKDDIDFGTTDIKILFRKMLYPTVASMVFSALFIIIDGIFVGRGVGSDALAAVNIVAPVWLFATSIGLMFGMGGAVTVSVNMARGKQETARKNMTQAIAVSSVFLLICTVLILVYVDKVLMLLGCSPRLYAPAKDYIWGFVPFMTINALLCSTQFFIRLDASPRYAMTANVIATVLNIIFDYLFIFIFRWGIFGAAIATSLGSVVGVAIMLRYLSKTSNQIHFVPLKITRKSLSSTVRNTVQVCKIGFSSFLCEITIAAMMLCGNYVFMSYTGEPGVAAFSIACYFFPIIFMLYSSIAQSAQPIISYNYGVSYFPRVHSAFKIALKTAVICGVLFFVATSVLSVPITSLFINSDDAAYNISVSGLPLFAAGMIPFAINIISIGYFQSVERVKSAMFVTIMRGFVFIIGAFLTVPVFFGVSGIWLSVPVGETITTLLVLVIYAVTRYKEKHRQTVALQA